MARITIKQVNDRVDLLRTEMDRLKGDIEAMGLPGPRASKAGKLLGEALAPLFKNIAEIDERVTELEKNKGNKWWKFW